MLLVGHELEGLGALTCVFGQKTQKEKLHELKIEEILSEPSCRQTILQVKLASLAVFWIY
jgi:hypothetical protein